MQRKWFILVFSLAFMISSLKAQSSRDSVSVFRNLQAAKGTIAQSKALLEAVKFYLDKRVTTKADLQKSEEYLAEAWTLAHTAGSKSLEAEVLLLRGRHYLSKADDVVNAKASFMQAINYYHSVNDKRNEARAWYESGLSLFNKNLFSFRLSSYSTINPKKSADMLNAMQQSLTLARQVNDRDLQSRTLMRLAYYNYLQKDYDKATNYVEQAMALHHPSNDIKLYEIYHLLVRLSIDKGNGDQAIEYAHKALKNAQDTHHEEDLFTIYEYVGNSYFQRQKYPESIEAYEKAIQYAATYKRTMMLDYIRFYTEGLMRVGRSADAISFLKTFTIPNKTYGQVLELVLYQSLGRLNMRMRQFDESEKYYEMALKFAPKLSFAARMSLYIEVGEMYFMQRKYAQARPYFQPVVDSASRGINLGVQRSAHKFLYRLDSAGKDHQSALEHLLQYQAMSDKLANESIKKKVEELMIQHQTEKKEKDIQLLTSKVQLQQYQAADKEKDIQLLNSRLRLQKSEADRKEKDILLKNQRIDLLTQNGQLQESRLSKAGTVRKATIGGIILLLIILGLLYRQYWVKRKANQAITLQNGRLHQLVKEKELLMKEIHHRVKNNLHMVISLMESQAFYLENDALLALQNSQNRIQSMSMIHQKLYLTDNVTSIDISAYLRELIVYLKDSFGTGQRIRFELDLEQVELEAAQAVPLGLIVNELVTNSIKYAFPGEREGCVFVSLSIVPNNLVSLVVSDDGVGLPEDWIMNGKSSLGMQLVSGLSGDLGTQPVIATGEGTRVTIIFTKEEIRKSA